MSTDASIDPLVLRQLTQRLDHAVADLVDECGLTVDQWRMVERLAEVGAETMAGLTTALALTGPTTTRVADRLVSMALVYRGVDATDRRKVVLRLSRRGRQCHDRLSVEIRAQQDAAISGLEDTERELLVRLLSRAADEAPRQRSGAAS